MNRTLKVVLWVATACLLVFGVLNLGAFPTGITGVTMKGSTPGCTCHGASPSPGVSVVLSGASTLAPSQTGAYALQVSGGPLLSAGTNIAASAGSLSAVDASLQLLAGELTHTQPKAPSGEVVRFDFNYTAPASTGTVTLYANGNSVNLSGTNIGDQWNFANNFTITVQPSTGVASLGVPGSFGMDQNYPNPFNPSTTINFALPVSAHVTLRVYDAAGREVAVLLDETLEAGYRTVQWTAGSLASGVYVYRLEAFSSAGDLAFGSSKKLILMK